MTGAPSGRLFYRMTIRSILRGMEARISYGMVPRMSASSETDLHVDAGDVQHAHVHADVADGGGAVAVHREGGLAAAQMPVDAVGVTHGDGGDDGARGGLAPAAVADGVARAQVLDL